MLILPIGLMKFPCTFECFYYNIIFLLCSSRESDLRRVVSDFLEKISARVSFILLLIEMELDGYVSDHDIDTEDEYAIYDKDWFPQEVLEDEIAKMQAFDNDVPGIIASPSLPKRPINVLGTDCFSAKAKREFTKYLTTSRSPRGTLSQEKYDQYCSFLKTAPSDLVVPENLTPSEAEKYPKIHEWVNKLFELHDDKLYYKSDQGKIQAVCPNNAFDIIADVCKTLKHITLKDTYLGVRAVSRGLTYKDVEWFLRQCSPPLSLQASEGKPQIRPIVSRRPFERVQVALIDLSSHRFCGYAWILHIQDHFSRFSVLWPLRSISSSVIAECLDMYMRFFGTPDIIQCDYAKEFTGAVLTLLAERKVHVVQGRVRARRLQRLIRINTLITRKLTLALLCRSTKDWPSLLPFVARAINNIYCDALPRHSSPHQIVFGQRLKNFHREEPPVVMSTNDSLHNPFDALKDEEKPISKPNLDQREEWKDIFDFQEWTRSKAIKKTPDRYKAPNFALGHFCFVKLPQHLRAKVGNKRIVGKVVSISGDRAKLFAILTKWGVLTKFIVASEMASVKKMRWPKYEALLQDANPKVGVSMQTIVDSKPEETPRGLKRPAASNEPSIGQTKQRKV